MDNNQKEVCSIRIMFPVESDEQAIELKRKIAAVLSDISNVRIDFSISNVGLPPMRG